MNLRISASYPANITESSPLWSSIALTSWAMTSAPALVSSRAYASSMKSTPPAAALSLSSTARELPPTSDEVRSFASTSTNRFVGTTPTL